MPIHLSYFASMLLSRSSVLNVVYYGHLQGRTLETVRHGQDNVGVSHPD